MRHPLTCHIVIEDQVDHNVAIFVDQSHATHEVEWIDYEQTYLLDPLACINWHTPHLIACRFVVHFEQRTFDSVGELELETVQVWYILPDNFPKLDGFAVVVDDLLQLLG